MVPYQVSSNYSPGVKFDPNPGVTSFTWDCIGKILEISLYVAIRPRVRATKLCHGLLSVVRLSVRALTFSLNIFLSETTCQILMKFLRNVPAMVLFRIS